MLYIKYENKKLTRGVKKMWLFVIGLALLGFFCIIANLISGLAKVLAAVLPKLIGGIIIIIIIGLIITALAK